MKLILIGPSGAGKGSLAEYLVRDYGIPHISTGQMFRDNITNKTPLGMEAEKYINEGLFVPDEITAGMLFDRISQPDCQKGFILDGYPRSLNQAMLLSRKVGIDRVIEITASNETVLARLGGRYMCKKCGQIHNTLIDEDITKCRDCGDELYQREDDREEKILKRLEQYYAQADPILEFYRSQGILITVKSEIDDRPVDLYGKFVGMMD